MERLTKQEIDDRRKVVMDRIPWSDSNCGTWLPYQGWDGILLDALDLIDFVGLGDSFKAVQIKEKFGTLRFYWDLEGYGWDTMEWKLVNCIIAQAENRSGGVCEMCGYYGSTRALGWVLTLCRECLYDRQPDHKDLNGWTPN